MQLLLFTKLFLGKSIEEIAETGADLGFDGIDLLVRNGHQVSPDDPAGIRPAVERLKAAGLSVPMATTDITDPAGQDTEAIFAALAEAGIATARLGYWKYDPATGYRAIFDRARRDLDALAEIAGKTGIALTIQLHGDTIHGSGAQTAALLAGHDGSVLGAYADPGNQTVQDGREDWRFTLDILGPWLTTLGVKNGGWFPAGLARTGQREWHSDWLGLAEGMVPWDRIIRQLVATGFDGILTLHSHYEVPYEQVIDQTRSDLHYVRRLIAEGGAQA